MTTLRDIAALSDVLLELHAQPTLDAVAGCAVRGIEGLIPCDWASVSLAPSASGQNQKPRFWSIKHDQQDRTVAQSALFYREHPMWNRWWRDLSTATVELADLAAVADLDRLGVQHEVFRPLRIANMLGDNCAGSSTLAMVAVRDRRREFSERDHAMMRAVMEHTAAAANRLADAEGRSAATEFIGLDAFNRPVRWSRGAEPLVLRDRAGLPALPDPVSRWLHEAAVRPSQAPATLRIPHAGRSLAITRLTGRGPYPAMLTVESFAAADRLRTADLTDRQREIARWVAAGKTNPEIATILGISARTVQKHLEHIFARLGVPTRTALAAELLASDPRRAKTG